MNKKKKTAYSLIFTWRAEFVYLHSKLCIILCSSLRLFIYFFFFCSNYILHNVKVSMEIIFSCNVNSIISYIIIFSKPLIYQQSWGSTMIFIRSTTFFVREINNVSIKINANCSLRFKWMNDNLSAYLLSLLTVYRLIINAQISKIKKDDWV